MSVGEKKKKNGTSFDGRDSKKIFFLIIKTKNNKYVSFGLSGVSTPRSLQFVIGFSIAMSPVASECFNVALRRFGG